MQHKYRVRAKMKGYLIFLRLHIKKQRAITPQTLSIKQCYHDYSPKILKQNIQYTAYVQKQGKPLTMNNIDNDTLRQLFQFRKLHGPLNVLYDFNKFVFKYLLQTIRDFSFI